MRKIYFRGISFLLIIFVIIPLLPKVYSSPNEDDFAWVLVNVIDYEPEIPTHDSYEYSGNYARGSYSSTVTYKGPDYYGEGLTGTLSVKAEFSGMPELIQPEVPVSIKLNMSTLENSVVGLHFAVSCGADFDKWELKPGGATGGNIAFKNEKGNYNFKIHSLVKPSSHNEILIASLGKGYEGDKIALRLKYFAGYSMMTNYVYEWKSISTKPFDDGANNHPEKEDSSNIDPSPSSEAAFWSWWENQAEKWTQQDIEEAINRRSYDKPHTFVKFGDLHGEVMVLRGWESDRDEAFIVDYDTPLYHGDLIITSRRSGAILSFADMSTYNMGKESYIILDLKPDNRTIFDLVAGRVWVNVQKMFSGGSMEIEMGQVVAGIKGTTFICEEDPENKISTIEVFEGSVEVILKNSGKKILVKSGKRLDVYSNQTYKKTDFNIDEELKNWDEETQTITKKAMATAGKHNKYNPIIIVAIFFSVLTGAVIVLILVKRKKGGT